MNWYCDVAPGHEFHGPYHENEYGFPIDDDNKLFERLCLEIMQAGLSWLTILKKKDNLSKLSMISIWISLRLTGMTILPVCLMMRELSATS